MKRKLSQEKKKNILRVVMFIMAVVMILSFVMLPLSQEVSAEEDVSAVTVTSFETGKLSAAIDEAKNGTDLNLIKKLAVSGGTLNAADYQAICGYPNIEYLELAGSDTENGIIPDNALSSRNQLTYVSLPKNTETIGSRAFSGNRVLLKISIPATLRHIGDYAFEGCEKVEEFSVPAELETLGAGAFSDCKSLLSFSVPQAVTAIPENCFSKASLTEMHIGPQVTSVGNGAFSDCHGLTDIYFYGKEAFSAPEGAFQNLKVTIHTYDGGEGFDALKSNFVTVAYDLSEDSVYIPPEPSSAPAVSDAADEDKTEEASETEEEQSEDVSEDTQENIQEDTPAGEVSAAPETSQTEAVPVSAAPAQSGFSGVSVIVIAVLCVVVGVLGALLAVKSKKK